jgi:uncharacterized integral membrane protein (TIGR00698 family)
MGPAARGIKEPGGNSLPVPRPAPLPAPVAAPKHGGRKGNCETTMADATTKGAPGAPSAPAGRGAPAAPGFAAGLILAVVLAALALLFRDHVTRWISPLVTAMVLGIAVNSAGAVPESWRPGVSFAGKALLRLTIVLMGTQISLGQVVGLGFDGLAIALLPLAATFFATIWLAAALGADRRMGFLLATGTAVCGASAILAANATVRGREEDVAYALALITVLGCLGIVAYPYLAAWLGLTPRQMGLWAGATLHEVVQVVGAAYQGGEAAAEIGTISKLARVLCLAPVLVVLGAMAGRANAQAVPGLGPAARSRTALVPWYVLGFMAVVVLNSVVALPAAPVRWIGWAIPALLAVTIAAMGLETRFVRVAAQGWRPFAVGTLSALFIAALGLAMIWLLGARFA